MNKKPRGRPCTYTATIATQICEHLAAGETLRAICRGAGMPSEGTVRGWVLDDVEGFASQYRRARDLGLDVMADEMLDIADTPLEGERREESEDGVKTIREDMLGHRRLQIEARKWYLCKLAPKKYGDKQQIEHSGTLSIAEALRQARARRRESE